MNYDLVWLEERQAAGISKRMNNSDADLVPVIGGMWQTFFSDTIGHIPCKKGGTTFGIYHNYDSDHTGRYDLTVCCEVEPGNHAGIETVTIPAGMYARFRFHGDMTKGTGTFWAEVWKTELNRKYTADFEEYPASADSTDGDIYVYIAVNDVCQSCGMPLSEASHYAVNADGTPNTDYCSYCYKDGHFTDEMTMEEMAAFCAPILVHEGVCADEQTALSDMKLYFPTLKRWKQTS